MMRRFQRSISAALRGLVLGMVAGCVAIPSGSQRLESAADALQIMRRAAEAQGGEALERIHDVNVSYDGEWFGLVAKLQPVLVDREYRGRSQERILLRSRMVAQAHVGAAGSKQVWRTRNAISVWYNGSVTTDAAAVAAAAIVADAYRMFLLGPFFFFEAGAVFEYKGTSRVESALCDVILATLRPGLGKSAEDRVLIYVEKGDSVVRRVRFTLDGLETTRGAIVDVDMANYVRIEGVRWPTTFFERVRRPIPIPAHRWTLTGLDVNRDYTEAEISGAAFRGSALPAATPISPTANY